MANHDHRDNIGTHPAYSQDPETRLRARLEAASNNKNRADRAFTDAKHALADFLAEREAAPQEVCS